MCASRDFCVYVCEKNFFPKIIRFEKELKQTIAYRKVSFYEFFLSRKFFTFLEDTKVNKRYDIRRNWISKS